MRKKLVIGSLMAVCLLMMLPSISAVESNTVGMSDITTIKEKIMRGATGNPLIDSLLVRLVGVSMVLAAFFYVLVYRAVPSQ